MLSVGRWSLQSAVVWTCVMEHDLCGVGNGPLHLYGRDDFDLVIYFDVFFFQAEDGIRDVAVTGVPDVCSSDLQLSYQLLQILREVYQRRDLHRICVANVQ